MTTRAAVYLRISQDRARDGLAVERQREDCERIVKERKWKAVEVYVDQSVSAYARKTRRPAYERMVADYKAGRFDALVCWDLDRLTRQPAQLESWIEAAEDRGLVVVTANGEADLSNDNGRMFARIKATIARAEQERKSTRQKRANAQRSASGERTGSSRRQFGFSKDGVTLIESEAAAVRDGYEALLSGVPLAGIARDWNARGLTTTQKRQARSGHAGEPSPWLAGSVRSVLLNPRNAGIVTYQGEELRVVEGLDGTQKVVTAKWPALVSEETFRAAAAIFADPSRRHLPRYGKHLLSGLALCGVEGCGGHAHAGGNARRGVPGYRCSASAGHFARMAEPIERYVEGVVIARLSRSDARVLLEKPSGDKKALRRDALAIEHRIEELAGLVADGTFNAVQARSAAERLRTKKAEIEASLADAGRVDVLGPLVRAADVAATWESLDTDRRRAVIDTLMAVTIHPVGRGTRTFRTESVGIDWKAE